MPDPTHHPNSPILINPVDRPVQGTVRPPGSKSIKNRALVLAALADGTSHLSGLLDSDDTRVMLDGLARLGIALTCESEKSVARVAGCAGRPPAPAADIWTENSGTSMRFLTAIACLGRGNYRLDGNDRMRQRPIADLCEALGALGGRATCERKNGCPPVRVAGAGLRGGRVEVRGDTSSQFLSGLLMAAPCAEGRVELVLAGHLVSEPYVAMTVRMMKTFGVDVDESIRGAFLVAPQRYRSTSFRIEPDASAASYFFAAAAVTGGRVTVPGLSRDSLQGDVQFAGVLERMGCRVAWDDDAVTVEGGPLHGVDLDMNAISDTVQTLAVTAIFADGPTRIRNVAHIRHKETDRIRALVTELRRLGIAAEENDDGLVVHPGRVTPGLVETYNDHRMAMSFALAGLKVPGIRINDPACTAKTYPHYFADLQVVCRGAN